MTTRLAKLILRNTYKSIRLIEFTTLQLLQRNVQLGATVEFSLLSSYWFICGVRQTFTIIDFTHTIPYYRHFLRLLSKVVFERRRVLFVNERHYISQAVSEVAVSVGEPYIMGRWVGGTLTNFKKICLAYNRLLRYKRIIDLNRFRANLKRSLDGIKILNALPGAVFFNSAKNNFWGTGESYALHIPSAAIADTDSFSANTLYPIPGNDDAFGSIFFLNQLVAKTILVSKLNFMTNFGLKVRFINKRTGRKKKKKKVWKKRRFFVRFKRVRRVNFYLLPK